MMINFWSNWVYETGIAAIGATIIFGTLAIVGLFQFAGIPQNASCPGEKNKSLLPLAWPTIEPNAFSFNAEVFKKIDATIDSISQGSISKRFRLAGTFFAVGINQHSRKAILDDLQKKEQSLVTEGELIDNEIQIVSILSDRIVLRKGTTEEQIILCFTGGGRSSARQTALAESSGGKLQLEIQNRFGKRVGDKRWVLKRSEILNYYAEVLNNTDKLAEIYESLKPVYEGRNISGYTLDIEGEADMFASFGLRQGDVIRQVNSLPMTSQIRAEYFINEFVKNRVNGFVLDIERAGQKEKLIYMIR